MPDLMQRPWLGQYDAQVPSRLEYPSIPLHQFLRSSAQNFPERAALVFNGNALSYAVLDTLSDALARWLVKWGLQPGDRVGTFMPNIPQFVLIYYAVLKAGGVVVALNPQYKQREAEFQLQDAGVRLLFGWRDAADLLATVQPATLVEQVVLTSFEDASFLDGVQAGALEDARQDSGLDFMDCLRAGLVEELPLPNIGAEDVAIFQYTGGTTGIPKAAVGLHRNLVTNTVQFSAWLSGLRPGQEVVLAAIPLFHVYGMVIAMSMGIALGATVVLVPDPRNIPEVLRNIQTYGATLFPGVPTMYAAINQFPEVKAGRYDLRTIKACISGSAPLRKEIKQQFEALTGGKLLEGYGLSEAPTATHCNPMWGENRTGSIGLPLPDVDACILDLDDGTTILTVGQPGELAVRGPQIMQGYHHMPEETGQALRNGWLHTGDIARMDEDGYFYIIDRKKDVIKVGGLQVWPREVEEVIALHPAICAARR
jgi:long-chain acyl-CoA synthetase